MIKEKLIELTAGFLGGVFLSYAEGAADVLSNAARDTFESVITGRQTIEEWAEIAIKGVDRIKDRVAEENVWKYVGGKLHFALSTKSKHKVVISFELYYHDENAQWKKVSAQSDLYASNFTLEALADMESQGVVSFEVE